MSEINYLRVDQYPPSYPAEDTYKKKRFSGEWIFSRQRNKEHTQQQTCLKQNVPRPMTNMLRREPNREQPRGNFLSSPHHKNLGHASANCY